jgi:uncharacterized iron-regulated membrane protein
MKRVLVTLHRWLGLFTAAFLFIAGLTGAIIAWEHELDAWLNPHLYFAKSTKPALSALEIAERIEHADSRLRVRYLPLATEPGRTLIVFVEPRNASEANAPSPLDFDHVAVDPATAEIQGRRHWAKPTLSRESLLPFIYKLHYSLHIPTLWGRDLGTTFMGIIAVVWFFDSLIALYISFPRGAPWRRSFAFRLRGGSSKLTFDLHRSGGVWVWPLLLLLAVTGVSLSLNRELMRPLVSLFSQLTPNVFDSNKTSKRVPTQPAVDRRQIVERAQREAHARGIREPIGALFYAADRQLYGAGFFKPGNDHGDGGLGNAWLYWNASGSLVGAEIPGRGSGGDLFLQAQFPLHSGRIIGRVGRVIVSVLGIAVAMLSVTGVLLWARKRRRRVTASAAPNTTAALAPGDVY